MKNLCLLLVTLFFFPYLATSQWTSAHPGMEWRAEGTGRTTGHVITLNVRNTTKEPFNLTMGGYYIPSDGKHQGYLIPPIPDSTLVIDPEASVSLPLHGYCTEIDKPPVNAEDNPIHYDEWIPGSELGGGPEPYTPLDEEVFKPIDTTGIITIPYITGNDSDITDTITNRIKPLITTYPGTDIGFPYKVDITEHAKEIAPILFEVIDLITETYDSLRDNDLIVTPFSFDKEKERESVIQQTFWIYTSILEDEDPYDIRDFESKMEEQLELNTGQDIDEMDVQVREQLNTGVNQFWDAFTLVGTEAKVISSEPSPAPPPVLEVEEEEKICEYQFGELPGFEFDMVIDDSWKDEEERNRLIAQAREQISSQGYWSPDEDFYTVDGGLDHHPTSANAFFKDNVVGGFCSGYAKTYFYNADEGSEYVSSTEPINLDIDKSATVSLTVIPPRRWTSFVVGSSFSKLRASSSSFDAVAGNTEHGLDFLRVTKFAAKTALKYLIDCATGGTTASFGSYAREAVEGELQSAAEQAAQEEINEYVNENYGDVLDELGLSENDVENLSAGRLIEVLEDKLGIEINSLGDIIDEGLDAALNIFFVSNTYAAANGGLVVKIGNASESALAHSKALYLRTELEDSEDAVTGSGEKVDSFYVSDVQPNSIAIETTGIVLMMTRAKGNGSADAYLESIQLQALVGVCKGPRPRYEWTTEINTGAYFNDQENAPEMGKEFIDQLVNELDAKIDDELNYDSSMEEWKNTVDEFIREKSVTYPFNK